MTYKVSWDKADNIDLRGVKDNFLEIIGGNSNDTIYGGDFLNYIAGDCAWIDNEENKDNPPEWYYKTLKGNDSIYGGPSYDFIHGGLGNDKLWGGKGFNIFQFKQGGGTDTISMRTYANSLSYEKSDNDLIISYNVSNTTSPSNITLKNYYKLEHSTKYLSYKGTTKAISELLPEAIAKTNSLTATVTAWKTAGGSVDFANTDFETNATDYSALTTAVNSFNG